MRISDWSSDVCSSDLKGSEEMPQHVMRRGNRLYYNRAWPLDVQGKLGSAPFRRSLHTDSLREAVRSLPDMDREFQRSEERRGGKECVSKCRSRWSPIT